MNHFCTMNGTNAFSKHHFLMSVTLSDTFSTLSSFIVHLHNWSCFGMNFVITFAMISPDDCNKEDIAMDMKHRCGSII